MMPTRSGAVGYAGVMVETRNYLVLIGRLEERLLGDRRRSNIEDAKLMLESIYGVDTRSDSCSKNCWLDTLIHEE